MKTETFERKQFGSDRKSGFHYQSSISNQKGSTGIAIVIVFSRAEETVQYPAAVKMYEFLELRKHRMGLE